MKADNENSSSRELLDLKARLANRIRTVPYLEPIRARLQRAIELPELLAKALQTAIELTGADFGNIQLVDEQSGCLKIVAQRGFKEDFLEYFNEVHDGQATCGSALKRKSRVIVEDVVSHPIFKASEAGEVMLKAEARACQSTPLIGHDGKVLGMVSTHYRVPCRPDQDKLTLLDVLAVQIAELVDMAHIERILQEYEQLVATAELSARLAHELNNPLQALTNLVVLLSKEPISEEASRWLDMSRQELDRIVEITQHLLMTRAYQNVPISLLTGEGGQSE